MTARQYEGTPLEVALACQDCNVRRGSTDWLTYASIKQGELVA